jgi:hypothetical protein
MFRSHLLIAVCAFLILAAVETSPVSADPFRYPEAVHGKGDLKYVNGLPVLSVAGTPEEIGEAIGVLAVRPARRMLDYPEDLLRHFHLHLLWRPIVSEGNRMVEHFPEDYRRELEAMVRGGAVERDPVVAGNTLFDLKKLLACSALLVEAGRSDTHGPLLGRNLDYPSLGYAHEYSLVTIYRSAAPKHAFASVGFPGLVGCLSGMNDAGLAVAILEVFQIKLGEKKYDPCGTPYALCYRRLLEECTTIEEARQLLEKMQRTTITNLAVADRNGVAVFEVSPGRVVVRRPQQGACACTNHFCSAELGAKVPINLFWTIDRYQILDKAVKQAGKLGVEDLHHNLDAVAAPTETLQTMVFEPAALRLHLAIGTCPSSAAELRLLELAPLLQSHPGDP